MAVGTADQEAGDGLTAGSPHGGGALELQPVDPAGPGQVRRVLAQVVPEHAADDGVRERVPSVRPDAGDGGPPGFDGLVVRLGPPLLDVLGRVLRRRRWASLLDFEVLLPDLVWGREMQG